MAAFTLTIADADVTRVTTALCAPINVGFNLPAADTVDAPTAQARVIQFIIAATAQYEAEQAAAAFVPPVIS
jgi:hypothetical protein